MQLSRVQDLQHLLLHTYTQQKEIEDRHMDALTTKSGPRLT